MYPVSPTTTSSRTGSWSARRRSPTPSASLRRTEGLASQGEATDLDPVEARLQAVLDPYRERLPSCELYGAPYLQRAGAKAHDWFAGVSQGNGVVRFFLLPMHHHPELLD